MVAEASKAEACKSRPVQSLRRADGHPHARAGRSRATERILAANSAALILTTFDLDEYVFKALRAGASGFRPRDDSPEQLIAAIRAVASGETLLSPAVTTRVIKKFVRTPHPDPPIEFGGLSERERDVFTAMVDGRSNAEIANALYISEATVKTHHMFFRS